MAKRKSSEEKLGALIREIGFEKAEAAFKLIKSYETKPETKRRKPFKPCGPKLHDQVGGMPTGIVEQKMEAAKGFLTSSRGGSVQPARHVSQRDSPLPLGVLNLPFLVRDEPELPYPNNWQVAYGEA